MRRIPARLFAVLLATPAAALVGGAPEIGANGLGRHVVMIVGSNGSFCTGAALARDVVLTAAHCVLPGADYKLVEFDSGRRPSLKAIAAVARHPEFTLRGLKSNRGTADLALIKLAEPLPSSIRPAALSMSREIIKVGDRFTVTGYGITRPTDARSGGTLRAADLVATSRPDSMDVRLTDPATNNARLGLGACTGDSGAPVFQRTPEGTTIVGVVGWSMGPKNTQGCGGITGVTPIARYRAWIVQTARRWGRVITP